VSPAKASVAELAKLPGVWRGGELEHVLHSTVPTGHAALDRELPGGGWPTGTLAEVLHDGEGMGEVGFLAQAVAKASEGERLIAWIHPPHLPYAPALDALGVPLERVLVVQPASREDALWAAEQAMRSGACGAVMLWLEGLRSARARGTARRDDEYASLRRLQMAAESGRCLAVHFRAASAAKRSTPAHLRVAVTRQGHRLVLRILKRRGPTLTTAIALSAGWQPHVALSAPLQEQPEHPAYAAQPARAFSIVR
jgi:hypothetical protein